MMFGEILYSIEVLHKSIKLSEEYVGYSKAADMIAISGTRHLCELLQRDFDNNLSNLTTEQEQKIDSELEYLFIKLKELEDVVNERNN